ncbi:hypothetical protein [Pseudomonas batumici]|uniref:hypothetical protein n=1 Tax=Pseudomonas batumici TaxID=226910 RepID=UPI0012ED2FB3|nr:hypothetical protein [Pseudomonas batumici]
MGFGIFLDHVLSDSFGVASLKGVIHLSGSQEFFYAPVSYWGRREYIESWRAAFTTGYARGEHSVLVTSMLDPEKANFLTVWVLYYVGSKVYVQNSIVFLDEVGEKFDVSDPNSYVGPREKIDEDGNEISEWEVSLDDVVSFFEGLS